MNIAEMIVAAALVVVMGALAIFFEYGGKDQKDGKEDGNTSDSDEKSR